MASEDPTKLRWSAADVRDCARLLARHSPPIGGLPGTLMPDMLLAYADHLTSCDGDGPAILETGREMGRDEGRREVYAELANDINPYDTAGDERRCNFCGERLGTRDDDGPPHNDWGYIDADNPKYHQPSCLWLRARHALGVQP